MACGWEDNRRSGVARRQWFSTYGLKALQGGDEHPDYALLVGYGKLYLTFTKLTQNCYY